MMDIGTCQYNLVSMHLMVSEKTMSTDGWTRDDGRPRHDSSSAAVAQSRAKKNPPKVRIARVPFCCTAKIICTVNNRTSFAVLRYG